MSEQAKSKPWYKQFWPWFIISIPLASVIAGIFMIVLSIDGADTLVKEDYYKEGLAINKSIKKLQKAKELGVTANLVIQGEKVELTLNSLEPITEPLFIDFQHATQPKKDFSSGLQQTTDSQYFVALDKPDVLQGKWYITLYPHSKKWLVEQKTYIKASEKNTIVLGE